MSGRLPKGGLIDRGVALGFRFDGEPLGGHPGDTLASALLASGKTLFGRSFKYHRPRGVLTAGPEEPNALVELRAGARREPNTRATTARTVRRAGGDEPEPLSLAALRSRRDQFAGVADPDRGLLLQDLHVAVGVLGKALRAADPPLRGAGPGERRDRSRPVREGLRALRRAGRRRRSRGAVRRARRGAGGARVILADEDFRLGGRLNAERFEIDGRPGAQWAEDAARELAALGNVRIFRRTTVFGVYDSGVYGALERVADHLPTPPPHQPRQRLWRIVAKRAVLAAGAIERPIAFGGNDRPGVMLASAVRTYLNRFAVACGRDAVIFTTSDDGWRTAADMSAAGLGVAAIVDARPEVAPAVRALAGAARVHLGSGGRRRARRAARARRRNCRSRRATIPGRSRPGRGRGRLQPAARPDHASRRQAALARRHRGLRSRRTAQGHERRGRVRRDFHSGGRASRRPGGRRRRGGRRRPCCGGGRASPSRRRSRSPSRRSGMSRRRRPRPSSISRTTSPSPTSRSPRARVSLRSSI